jgi:glutathione S-transferase
VSEAKLYVILGSHACRTGMLMLEHKGIPYRTVTLPSGFHPMLLRLHGFAGHRAPFRRIDDRPHRALARADRLGTVPVLRMNGTRVQTNREIARHLDEVQPDPPLFPAEPGRRREVEEAEEWGDEVFQMAARRLALAAAVDGGLVNRGGAGRLGPLLWRRDAVRMAMVRGFARVFAAGGRGTDRLRAELPGMLDRIDGWIQAGTLNGEQLNAADFMIAPSLALLTYCPELRIDIESRPAARLVDRILPEPATTG